MKAVILAGGLGTRLRAQVPDKPKVMAPVADKPFLEYHIRYIQKFNIHQIICCLGYKAQQVIDYFGTGRSWGVEIEYVIEEKPLGTAGAFKNAGLKEPFIGLNGDSFIHLDYHELLNYFSQVQAPIIVCRLEKNPSRYGSIAFDEQNRIVSFSEKINSNTNAWINAGVYILTPELIESIPDETPSSLEQEIFPQWANKGIYAFPSDDYFIDIGTPESYARAQKEFLNLKL